MRSRIVWRILCAAAKPGEMRLMPVPKPGERRLLLVAGGAGGRAAAGGGWVGAIAGVAVLREALEDRGEEERGSR